MSAAHARVETGRRRPVDREVPRHGRRGVDGPPAPGDNAGVELPERHPAVGERQGVLRPMLPEPWLREAEHLRHLGEEKVVERRLEDPADVEDHRLDARAGGRRRAHANAGMTCLATRSICRGSSLTGPSTMYSIPADTRSAMRALIRSTEPTM